MERQAHFILSTGEACHEERLEIIGTKARILLEDDTLTITNTEMYVSISRTKKSTQGRI